MTPDLATSLEWMDAGTAFFTGQLARLGDHDLAGPSSLPGWTRLHVVSHMARNARALMNLVAWATTGVETPMYPSPDHRRDDIEAGTREPAATVRTDALREAVRLADALHAMAPDAWSAPVRTALGWEVAASEIPWMRVREVWVHAVDLDAGATVANIDQSVARALLVEAAERLSGRDDVPALLLVPAGGGGSLALGAVGSEPMVVGGSTQALAGWLLGRTDGDDLSSPGALPPLPAWM